MDSTVFGLFQLMQSVSTHTQAATHQKCKVQRFKTCQVLQVSCSSSSSSFCSFIHLCIKSQSDYLVASLAIWCAICTQTGKQASNARPAIGIADICKVVGNRNHSSTWDSLQTNEDKWKSRSASVFIVFTALFEIIESLCVCVCVSRGVSHSFAISCLWQSSSSLLSSSRLSAVVLIANSTPLNWSRQI